MMSAPYPSSNGPDAKSWFFSTRLVRYARCAGRAASTFALSWLYSITAANFMGFSPFDWGSPRVAFDIRRNCDGHALRREVRPAQHRVRPEQGGGEDHVAGQGA